MFLCFNCFLDDEEPEITKVTQPHKTTLERWEESCLLSTSLSQVFLHLSTLEKAVTWSKSVLHTRCKLCRRKGDPEKMLLCDQCDRGHHMYCLKPPLKVITFVAPDKMIVLLMLTSTQKHMFD